MTINVANISRRWLYGSATGLMLAAPMTLQAAMPAAIAPTVAYATIGQAPRQQSAVEAHLEELHRRDGRDLPQLEKLDMSQTPAHLQGNAPAKRGFSAEGFIDRLFSGRRFARPAATPPSRRPQPAPTDQPRRLPQVAATPAMRPAPMPAPVARPATPLSLRSGVKPGTSGELTRQSLFPALSERQADEMRLRALRAKLAAQPQAADATIVVASETSSLPNDAKERQYDVPRVAAVQPQELLTPTPTDAVDETSPYTGRTLESDPYSKPDTADSAGTVRGLFLEGDESNINEGESLDLMAGVSEPSQSDRRRVEPQAQLQRLAARTGVKGFKGFCPVTLRDYRRLTDGHPQLTSVHNECEYRFASAQAKAAFDADPQCYAPAHDGTDIVQKRRDGVVAKGTLDHALWYRGRVFLFTSAENAETFASTPMTFLD